MVELTCDNRGTAGAALSWWWWLLPNCCDWATEFPLKWSCPRRCGGCTVAKVGGWAAGHGVGVVEKFTDAVTLG